MEGRYRGTTELASLPCACECMHDCVSSTTPSPFPHLPLLLSPLPPSLLIPPVPPSPPNNLTLLGVSRCTILLSWDPSHFNGSRGTFFYTIWYRRGGDMQWTKGDTVNGNSHVVKYTQSGLIPHSQHIVRVTADSQATDTVPEGLAQLCSLNITVRTLPDGAGI